MAEATRVTRGKEELRSILRSGQIRSTDPLYSGYTFFKEGTAPKSRYFPSTVGKTAGETLGYVLRTQSGQLMAPDPRAMGWPERQFGENLISRASKEYYERKGYRVLPPSTPSIELASIQKIVKDPTMGGIAFGPERSFERFQQKYEGISAASKARSAMEMGRDLRPAARTLERALGGVGRAVGRAAGPLGVAMTAYDLAQAFPAPAPISEEKMGQALRSYRTGPQPAY